MDLLTIYLILILPSVGSLLGIASGIFVIVLFGAWFLASIDVYGEDEKILNEKGIKVLKKSAPYVLTAIVISTFIPSEKQMMYMIGGYAATNVEGVEKLPKNVVNAANKFLEQYTDVEEKK